MRHGPSATRFGRAINRLFRSRKRGRGADLLFVGPACRVLCPCGRRLHCGTSPGPVAHRPADRATGWTWGFAWACDRCGQPWLVDGPTLVAAWRSAQSGDQAVRLPLAR